MQWIEKGNRKQDMHPDHAIKYLLKNSKEKKYFDKRVIKDIFET